MSTSPFAITAASDRVSLDAKRTGIAAFTISNLSKRPVRARARATTQVDAEKSWLNLEGQSERTYAPGENAQVNVNIRVPDTAPPGLRTFRVDVVSVENPDEDFTMGPTISYEVPPIAAAPARKFPWLLIAAALIIVVGGAVAWWAMRKPSVPPSVVNQPIANARKLLDSAGFQVVQEPRLTADTRQVDMVIEQKPYDPGKGDRKVTLVVGAAAVRVPPLRGRMAADAVLELQRAGLKIASIVLRPLPAPTPLIVTASKPFPGDVVPAGASVMLVVSGRRLAEPGPPEFVSQTHLHFAEFQARVSVVRQQGLSAENAAHLENLMSQITR